jgi:hypothetical protein
MSDPEYVPVVDDARVREICREEIASLAGKALRRTQDLEFTRSPDRNLALEVANEQMAQFWGEVLAEYGGAPEALAVDPPASTA